METIEARRGIPAIVVLAAALDILSALFGIFMAIAGALGLIWNHASNLPPNALTQRLAEYQSRADLSFSVNFLFSLLLVSGLFMAAFFLAVGLGLLAAKKFSWFVQIIVSVFGLLGFPIFTVINAIVLVFFFQPRTREFFKV